MENHLKLGGIEVKMSDASAWSPEISVKEENIELEIDPLSLCDEGIETDYESEEKYSCIDYRNWYKSSVAELSRGLCLPFENEKDESFFNYNPLGGLAETSFVCFYCGELWNNRNSLKFHIKHIHMAKQSTKPFSKGFECFYCKKKFKNIQKLLIHTTRKHKQKYKKKRKIGENTTVKGSKEKPFFCQFCDYRAEHRCLVNSHIKRVHEKIKPYHCPHCDFRSAYNHTIRHHIESKHIKSESKRVKHSVYNICGDRFIKSLNSRFQVMLKQDDLKPFACPKCDYRATRANILKNHLKHKHEKVYYYCPYCEFKTILEKNLPIHLALEHSKSKESYTCPFCDFITESTQDVKVHITTKHKTAKLHRCLFCNFQSPMTDELHNHMKMFHEEQKLHICSHCNYNCYSVSEMNSHTSSAHGTVSTLYSCAHCNFLSYNLEELKLHATAEHGKVELFSCSYCEFRCVQKEKLDIHMSIRHKNI